MLELKARNDKSKFLAKAGFTQANADMLRDAIRFLAASSEAVDDGSNEYGTFYRVEGDLPGANRFRLSVVTIWLKRHIDGVFQFVTLKPKGESR